MVERGERRRAELAVTLLAGKPDVGAALAKALAAATDADRAKLLAMALAPRLRELTPALRKQLRSTGLERLASGEPGAEAILDAARMADPGAVADELRALADAAPAPLGLPLTVVYTGHAGLEQALAQLVDRG